MKNLESKIFDGLNFILSIMQGKLSILYQKSFLLENIDKFILFFLLLTFVVSTFGSTNMIGAVSIFVPILVVLKVLITKDEKIELEYCNFYLLLYLFICFISNITSTLIFKSFYGFSKTFVYIMFYFALCQFFKTNKKYFNIILVVISALICIESLLGIFQNAIGLENISTWQDTSYVNQEDILTRVYGTLKPYNPNLFAGFLIGGFPSLLAILALNLKNKKHIKSIISFAFILIGMLTIFLTGCRGAYVALLSIIIGVIIASYNIIFSDIKTDKMKKIWLALFILFFIGGILFLAFNHGILQRILSIFIMRGDSSTSFRMNVYNSSLEMFKDNWLFGIGVGNKVFREIYGLYMLSGFDALSSYCIYLEMAVESGIFSLLAYILFVFSLFKSAISKFFHLL